MTIEKVNDCRLGLPSASALPLLFACAGAFCLQKIADEQTVKVDDSNPSSRHGVLLHAANETGDVSDLDEDDAEQVARARAIEESIVIDWLESTGHTIEDCEIVREKRFWVGGHYSCQIDLLVLNHKNKSALVADLKYRKKVNVQSWQLRACAVAVFVNYEYAPIRTAIVQPLLSQQPVCDYTNAHLNTARDRIIERLEYIKQPDLPRTPGDWCRYCAAVGICPELKKHAAMAISIATMRWDLAAPLQKLNLKKASILARAYCDKIDAYVRSDLQADPNSIPGLKLSPDQHPVSITNPAQVAVKLADKSIGQDPEFRERLFVDLMAVSKLSKANAISIIRAQTGMSKTDAERFLLVDCADAVKEGFRSGAVSAEES